MTYNNTCYKIVNQSNWFDAIDLCKSLGGSLATLSSLEEAKFIKENFTKLSLIWLHDLGQFSYGSLIWSSDGHGNISRNDSFENKKYAFDNASLNATYGNATLNGTLEMNSDMSGNAPGNITSEKMVYLKRSFLCPVFNKEYVQVMKCSTRLFGVCEIPGETVKVGREKRKNGEMERCVKGGRKAMEENICRDENNEGRGRGKEGGSS